MQQSERRKIAVYLLCVVLVALLVRLAALLLLESGRFEPLTSLAYRGDAIGYSQLAQNIADEGVFRFENGGPTAYRMPGYPIFLAFSGIFDKLPTAQLLQIAIDAFTCSVVFAIAYFITARELIAAIAGITLAMNPLLVIASISLLPETLVVSLIAVTIYVLIRHPDRAWTIPVTAVMLIAAVYLKPTLLLLAILLPVLVALRRMHRSRSFTSAASAVMVTVIIYVILLLPWFMRNLQTMDAQILLTTSSGSNLYGGNNPNADGGYVSDLPYVLPAMSELESDAILRDEALGWIRANPAEFLTLLPAKAIRFLWPLSLGTSGTVELPPTAMSIAVVLVLSYYVCAVFGSVTLVRDRLVWPVAVMLASLVGTLIPSLIAFGAARFSLPATPALAVLFGVGAVAVFDRLRVRSAVWHQAPE